MNAYAQHFCTVPNLVEPGISSSGQYQVRQFSKKKRLGEQEMGLLSAQPLEHQGLGRATKAEVEQINVECLFTRPLPQNWCRGMHIAHL